MPPQALRILDYGWSGKIRITENCLWTGVVSLNSVFEMSKKCFMGCLHPRNVSRIAGAFPEKRGYVNTLHFNFTFTQVSDNAVSLKYMLTWSLQLFLLMFKVCNECNCLLFSIGPLKSVKRFYCSQNAKRKEHYELKRYCIAQHSERMSCIKLY